MLVRAKALVEFLPLAIVAGTLGLRLLFTGRHDDELREAHPRQQAPRGTDLFEHNARWAR